MRLKGLFWRLENTILKLQQQPDSQPIEKRQKQKQACHRNVGTIDSFDKSNLSLLLLLAYLEIPARCRQDENVVAVNKLWENPDGVFKAALVFNILSSQVISA